MKMKTPQSGFTLIEVMIVVAIVAILAAVALPSYQEHVRKSKRAECQAVLVSYANALERRFSISNSYLSGIEADIPGFSCPSGGGATTYGLDFEEATATTYILVATREPGSSQEGDRCGDLKLHHTGQKEATDGDDAECW